MGRLPVALGLMDPTIRGHPHLLFRQRLKDFVPPAWVRQIVVVADAGFAANATLRLITEKHSKQNPQNTRRNNFPGEQISRSFLLLSEHLSASNYPGAASTDVFAMPRTRKLTNGKHLRDLVHHLPKSCSYRRASHKPDGRRRDYWVFLRRATRHNLGAVTIVLSKKRRNDGPKGVKMLVTNLPEASAGAILSMYAWRWGVELTIKELKSGLHVGQMQVTKDKERVKRSVALSVLAYLLLVRLYGHEHAPDKVWSLCKLKDRFIGESAQEAVTRTERKWQRKLQQFKDGG